VNDRKWSLEVDLAKGEPENPASWDEVCSKFRGNAAMLLSEEEVEMLGQAITDLDKSSLGTILRLI
jgi:2-methylcitrate dehydratase PrpD